MNKQQLATKIWESANKMRSKIEANEYKDYILGFIFYKYISDYQVKYLIETGYTEQDLKDVTEDDEDSVKFVQENLGYFISYENLFSTWLSMEKDFSIENVRVSLSAFNRLIYSTHKKVFDGIFHTLDTGLSKLGSTAGDQTKAVVDLINLIKDIPMDGKQDYDVLGFIYEYLISMFAANAGKKAGEFYTPHEVSVLMSEIVAHHLQNKETIQILDPTSGSGSLLINIGQSLAKFMENDNNIKYYAQELKENTYNLTRMNLVMRGIDPNNIKTRNADTLEDDWPDFDENDPTATYEPLYVDAVVSNPPYSQKWDPEGNEQDPRYAKFGIAPKTKADYAFLLHDLYHIKPDGIMTIVLPHGVLFRGGEEGKIRENLVENNHIDTIIGLPSNIFFGTGIPTVVMVLKQKRENTDILIIDASKCFIKDGKNNKLRACDIKKITDTIVDRKSIEKYSKSVTKEEIRNNEYNLNIPRYVDSSEKAETYDIYATMFGGIPVSEINELDDFWTTFPDLKDCVFTTSNTPYVELKDKNIKDIIVNHINVKNYKTKYENKFDGFDTQLNEKLIENCVNINIANEKNNISAIIFDRLDNIRLVDKYSVYQLFDDKWLGISGDLELIQREGFECTKQVDPNIVIKKKNNKDVEVQDGYIGHILTFDLVQENLLSAEIKSIETKENELIDVEAMLEENLENSPIEQDELESILNNDNTKFSIKEVNSQYKECLEEFTNDEISILNDYILIKKKNDKLDFIKSKTSVSWSKMDTNKENVYTVTVVKKYIETIKSNYEFDENSTEYFLKKVLDLLNKEKDLKSQIKVEIKELHIKTKETIENLTDEQVNELLKAKWISPLLNDIYSITDTIINDFISKITSIYEKYAVTYVETQNEIAQSEKILCSMLDELVADDFDMQGLAEFKKLLGGE